jgi:hypothetical protein
VDCCRGIVILQRCKGNLQRCRIPVSARDHHSESRAVTAAPSAQTPPAIASACAALERGGVEALDCSGSVLCVHPMGQDRLVAIKMMYLCRLLSSVAHRIKALGAVASRRMNAPRRLYAKCIIASALVCASGQVDVPPRAHGGVTRRARLHTVPTSSRPPLKNGGDQLRSRPATRE